MANNGIFSIVDIYSIKFDTASWLMDGGRVLKKFIECCKPKASMWENRTNENKWLVMKMHRILDTVWTMTNTHFRLFSDKCVRAWVTLYNNIRHFIPLHSPGRFIHQPMINRDKEIEKKSVEMEYVCVCLYRWMKTVRRKNQLWNIYRR